MRSLRSVSSLPLVAMTLLLMAQSLKVEPRDKRQGSSDSRRNCSGSDAMTKIAIMSVGKKVLTNPIHELKYMSIRTKEVLRARGVLSVMDSHRRHILEPLKRYGGFQVNYFVCVEPNGVAESIVDKLPKTVTKAWEFSAKNQFNRTQECWKRIMEEEEEAQCQYDIILKLRPDFLAFSDLPDIRLAIKSDCAMTRLRGAHQISGLTNEHMSAGACSHGCADGALQDGTGYMVDDMVAVVPRRFANMFWTLTDGEYRLPEDWPRSSGSMMEAKFTRTLVTHGIPVCPLALRGLPMQTNSPFVLTSAGSCNYVDGPPIPQRCHLSGKHSVDLKGVPGLARNLSKIPIT